METRTTTTVIARPALADRGRDLVHERAMRRHSGQFTAPASDGMIEIVQLTVSRRFRSDDRRVAGDQDVVVEAVLATLTAEEAQRLASSLFSATIHALDCRETSTN